jgi:hypothetical protein
MDTSGEPILRYESTRDTVRLVQVGDLHLSLRYFLKRWHLRRLRRTLHSQRPAIVVNTGDLFCRRQRFSPVPLLNLYSRYLGRHWPWAFCWGNHDLELAPDRYGSIERYLQSMPNSLYVNSQDFFKRRAAEAGVSPRDTEQYWGGNYVIEIWDRRRHQQRPTWQLFFFNARKNANIPPFVLDWAAEQTRKFGHSVPAVCFSHRPVAQMQSAATNGRIDGFAYERVASGGDTGVLHAKLVAMRTVCAFFVGHNHSNNFHCDIDGIRYHAVRKTLSLSYGTKSIENILRRKDVDRPRLPWGVTSIALSMDLPELEVATVLEGGRRVNDYRLLWKGAGTIAHPLPTRGLRR